ncbi:MAG: alpha-E domain-containing protein, partial [Caldilinea sp.]
MLSRVADSLYWMSRYLERADHIARQFDVHMTIVTEQAVDAARRRRRR